MARIGLLSLLACLWAVPAAAQEEEKGVRVHLVSDAPRLELRRVGQRFMGMGYGYRGPTMVSGAIIETLCLAPCGVQVDARRGLVFVGGQGITPSEEFSLAGYSGDVTVKVKTGSYGGFVGGVSLVTVGSVGVLTGVTLSIISAFNRRHPGLLAPGLVTTGVSIPMIVGGAFLLGGSQTHVSINPYGDEPR
jgi:hypothetical protein